MNKWVKTREGIIGLVVSKTKRPDGLVLGLDVNGLGDIWYADAKTVKNADA